MGIRDFMEGYKRAWESQDEAAFAALFTPDGRYHNTPFAVQQGPQALMAYWERIRHQRDIHVAYEILAETDGGGIAHWHVTYQVASEELFQIWAASTGTSVPPRPPGAPLPRMVLDGVLKAEFAADGKCREARIWWHSMPEES